MRVWIRIRKKKFEIELLSSSQRYLPTWPDLSSRLSISVRSTMPAIVFAASEFKRPDRIEPTVFTIGARTRLSKPTTANELIINRSIRFAATETK